VVTQAGANSGPFVAHPVHLQTVMECRAREIRPDELVDRARNRMETVTSVALARELWTGAASGGEPFDLPGAGWSNQQVAAGPPITYRNPRLADGSATVVGGGPLEPKRALGELEAAAGLRLGGRRVTIHCSPRLVPHLGVDNAGATLVTKAGSLVIADPGYTGDGPAAGEWMFATGPVLYAVGPVDVAGENQWTVNRQTNVVKVHAGRDALALFDPCALVGVVVTLA
jgi:hypothetical protein